LIDISSVLNALWQAKLVSRPGELFNYNSIGPWIAASILEHLYARPYTDLLRTHLLEPLGISGVLVDDIGDICPAIGQGLHVSAQSLMKLVLLHMHGAPEMPGLKESLKSLRVNYAFLLSSGIMKGAKAYPGWFDFGGRRFGHLGFGAGSAGVIRFLPDRDVAIVITARHQKLANAALAIMFKEMAPDLHNKPIPRILSAAEWTGIDPRIYKGVFENGAFRLEIDTAANGSLRGRVFRKANQDGASDAEPYVKRYYKACEQHRFFPTEQENVVAPSLEFSHPDAHGKFRYISTGNYAFSRAT
jgi:CubicO group peptidase (beta-lactamase class C family)